MDNTSNPSEPTQLANHLRRQFVGTRSPDFFIVGAPKCGTTSLAYSLAEHPDIFMTSPKEPHAFGADLTQVRARMEPKDYVALFRGVRAERRVGEASVWYLRSRTAAKEIHEFEPHARIIVMLRNPVDALYSLHGQAIRGGREHIRDFREALAAEPERRAGRRLGRRVRFPGTLMYGEAVDYGPQLDRYFQLFGREGVHVLLLEELAEDPGLHLEQVQMFLDVPVANRFELVRVNEARQVKSSRLQYMVKESAAVRAVGRALIPQSMKLTVGRKTVRYVERKNTRLGRSAMDPEIRAELTELYRPAVERLESILLRDLGHWKREWEQVSGSGR